MTDERDELVPISIACEIIGGRDTPIAHSTLWRGVKQGKFPPPLKLGPGTARWKRSEIMAVLARAEIERAEKAARANTSEGARQ